MTWTRRSVLLAAGSLLASSPVRALGRIPVGGVVELAVPWPVRWLDPHRIDDLTSVLFAPLVAEPLFALDAHGRPYPTLAATLPFAEGGVTRVTLRPHLSSGRGRLLDGRDVAHSIERSRASGGAALLSEMPRPGVVRGDPLTVSLGTADPSAVAAALASPVTALVPRGFSPAAPDGAGPFRAAVAGNRMELTRSSSAARGAPYLDRIGVSRARDLADALRRFETGDVDVGWLGAGLHRARARAVAFDAGSPAWIGLRTGAELGRWGAPGVAQQLADAVNASRLTHLGVVPLEGAGRAARYEGPPTDLVVDEDAPQLVEIARVVAGALSSPGHDVRLAPIRFSDLAERAARGRVGLAVEVVGRVGPTARDAVLALSTAADRVAARRPPRGVPGDLRAVTRTLPLGVLGELRITGARAADLELAGWSLADAWRPRG